MFGSCLFLKQKKGQLNHWVTKKLTLDLVGTGTFSTYVKQFLNVQPVTVEDAAP
jgi:hypothetical protein